MKKTLGVLLVAPFAVAILAFGAIVILENTVPVDISGIRWDYRENEGFQVREEGYLLEAEPIYDPALELGEGNDLVWEVSSLEGGETECASISEVGDSYYLEAISEGNVRLTCRNEKNTVSRSLRALIYEDGAILINDASAPASGQMVGELRRYGEYDFDEEGRKTYARIELETEALSTVMGDVAQLVSHSENLQVQGGIIEIHGAGESYVRFRLKEMPFVEEEYRFLVEEDAVNVYDYGDLMLATNKSEDGDPVCLQRNLLSLKNTYRQENGRYVEELLAENTRLFGRYDFGRQEMLSFEEDVYRFPTTYNDLYIRQYVEEEEGNNPEILQKRLEVIAGVHVQDDFFGNGFTISMQELCYPNHGKYDDYSGLIEPGEEDLFQGPLTLVSIGLIDTPIIKAFGQDNSGFYVEGDGILIDDVRLQNTDNLANLYDLSYAGSVIDLKGEDITIQNSFLRYGRTCLRAMDADGLLVRNCLMENSREFLMKVGSDEFASTDPEKRVTYQHKGDYYSGAISGLMDRSYGAADRLFNEALGLQEGDDPEGTLEPAMVIQEALDGDPVLEPAEIVVEDTLFGRSGLFPIAFDSLFNGPFLYNGLPSLIQDVFSIFTEFDIPFPSIVPDQVGGTSRASELTLRGDCRFYDWKDVETIDASCLIEERIGEFLGIILGTASGETLPRIPIDSYFPIKALLLQEAERLGYSYHVPVEGGEEGEEDIYLCPIVGYYGGGRNDSLLIHEDDGIGEEISIDFARSSITGEGLASAGSDIGDILAPVIARCVPMAAGFHPFRFLTSGTYEDVPETFGKSPDVSLIMNRGGKL